MRRGEKVTVDVQVHTVGEAAVETVVTVENQTVELEVEATHIPESIEVSIEGLAAGTQIHAADLVLPEGAALVTDPEILVVNITAAITAEALESELAEAEAEAGIEHEAPQAETEACRGSRRCRREHRRGLSRPLTVGSRPRPHHGFHRQPG